MSYEMTGSIKLIEDMQTFASGFVKTCFVITTKEKYPQDVKYECVKDRTALLDGVMVGDEVTVHFDIRGNEHNDRHYVNLNCWKLEVVGAEGTTKAPGADDMPEQEQTDGPLPF